MANGEINGVVHVFELYCPRLQNDIFKYWCRRESASNPDRWEECKNTDLSELARHLAVSQSARIMTYERVQPSYAELIESFRLSFEPPYSVEFDDFGGTLTCRKLTPGRQESFIAELRVWSQKLVRRH